MKLIEEIYHEDHKNDFKIRYLKYRFGRLKHQYWLWNRKRPDNKIIDEYDYLIIKNCQPGRTAFFSSSGYYLKDIWPEIDSIETYPVVKEFCPDIFLVNNRNQITEIVPYKFDNFAVVNNRSDHWVTVDGMTDQLASYCKALNPGARLFYSFRDTQFHYNRLIQPQQQFFYEWAKSLTKIDLTLVWSDINFKKKEKDGNGNYDGLENPDTTNGNLKFWFTFKGSPWDIIL